jgi:hypothetical protein
MHEQTASPAKPKLDYRTFDVQAAADQTAGFDGHASTFWAVDSYKTAMAPGAFSRTLKTPGRHPPRPLATRPQHPDRQDRPPSNKTKPASPSRRR